MEFAVLTDTEIESLESDEKDLKDSMEQYGEELESLNITSTVELLPTTVDILKELGLFND